MLKDPLAKKRFSLIILFILSIACYLVCLYVRNNKLYISFGDGRLYISAADNLLKTGHFVQTLRPKRLNMVVPFGIPMLLLPIRVVTKSRAPIIILQLLVYGLTNVLMHLTEKNFFKSSGTVSVLFLWAAMFYRIEGSPALLGCTEVWYIFLITAGFYVLSLEDMELGSKLLRLNIITYLAMVIRPFLSPFYIIVICVTLYLSLLKKRVNLVRMLPFYAVSSAVLLVFLFINHRESGQWALFENYAAMDLWWANNENSDPLESDIIGFYNQIGSTVGIDYARDNEMYKSMFREYVLTHPRKFISDTLLKYYIMYIEHWAFMIVPAFASAVLLFIKKGRSRRLFAAMFALFTIMSLTASVGILVHRYTLFIVPFYGLLLSGGAKYALDMIKPLLHKST